MSQSSQQNESRHFWVSGRVQGVSFRAYTQYKAIELGLSGWVRNLTDGRVELLASGAPEMLDKMEKWLWQGPEMADVKSVDVITEKPQAIAENFEII